MCAINLVVCLLYKLISNMTPLVYLSKKCSVIHMYDFKREFIKLSFTVYRVVFSAAE